MATKNVIVLLFAGLYLFIGEGHAQPRNYSISMTEIRIPGIITLGKYQDLIELQGIPNVKYYSSVNPPVSNCTEKTIAPQKKIRCEMLVYDAYEYVHVGDSVQLVFIDLRKSRLTIQIQDLFINERTSQNFFLSEIKKRGWWSDDFVPYKVGEMEYHYCTQSKVKNYLLNFTEDPYSSVTFTFHNLFFDKKIWWIEFPIMRIGGIVH